MVKKGEIRRVEITHKTSRRSSGSGKTRDVERKLVENLVELQKVHTHLAEKFDKLTEQIANLLGLFETAAKSFATQPSMQQFNEKDKEFLEKIDKLLEQNKTIAKGLVLMEDRIRDRVSGAEATQQGQSGEETRLQTYTPQGGTPQPTGAPSGEYMPSVNSQNRPLPRF